MQMLVIFYPGRSEAWWADVGCLGHLHQTGDVAFIWELRRGLMEFLQEMLGSLGEEQRKSDAA